MKLVLQYFLLIIFCLSSIFFCSPKPDCPPPGVALEDTVRVHVQHECLIGSQTFQYFTKKNGDFVEKILDVPCVKEYISIPKPIIDEDHLLNIGVNEAENMRLSGYEIDKLKNASGGKIVEINGDGLSRGNYGELEGYFIDESGVYTIALKVENNSEYTNTFSLSMNHVVLHTWTLPSIKSDTYITIEANLFLSTDTKILIHGSANKKHGGGRIDKIEIKKATPLPF